MSASRRTDHWFEADRLRPRRAAADQITGPGLGARDGSVASISQAITHDRLELHYQPVAALPRDESSPHGAPHIEVLLRLRDADGALHPARSFMREVEEHELTITVDRIVVDRALRALSSASPRMGAVRLMSINLSTVSVLDPGFRLYVADRFRAHDVAPSRVCFELSEDAVLRGQAANSSFAQMVREWGCKVALDDFGDHLWTLVHLQALPVDLVKIRGAYLRGLRGDPVCLSVVRAITEASRLAGMETIASQVDDASLIPLLECLKVDAAQGHALAMECALSRLHNS